MRLIGWVVLLVIAAAILSSVFKWDRKNVAPVTVVELTPQQKAWKEAEDKKLAEEKARWAREVLAVRQLKQGTKNPDSFKLEQAIRMADGTLCLSYRGTNSFNAVVPGHAVITKDTILSSGPKFDAVWKARCNGKRGDDIIHIRQAI